MIGQFTRLSLLMTLLLVCACTSGQTEEASLIIKADRILVDKSDRTLILYKVDKEIARYADIKLGDAPVGHKQFEGDEKTPEGSYSINDRNPKSAYHLSLPGQFLSVGFRRTGVSQ